MKLPYPTDPATGTLTQREAFGVLGAHIKSYLSAHFVDAFFMGLISTLILVLLGFVTWGVSEFAVSVGLMPFLKSAGIFILCALGVLGFILGLGEFLRRKMNI